MAGGGRQDSARQVDVRRRVKRPSDSFVDIDHVLGAVVSLSPEEASSLSLSLSDVGEGRPFPGGRGTTEESGSDGGLDRHSLSSSESSAASEKITLRPPAKMGSPPSMLPPPILEESFVTDMDVPPASPPPDIGDEEERKLVMGASKWVAVGTTWTGICRTVPSSTPAQQNL